MILISTLTPWNTSFFTLSVPAISSILLYYYILKHSIYFWSSFTIVEVSIPQQAMLQGNTLLDSSLNLIPICWRKEFPFECWFCCDNPLFNFPYAFSIICYHATQIVEIFQILRLSLICHSLHYGMVILSFLLSRVPRLFPIRRNFQFQSIKCTL